MELQGWKEIADYMKVSDRTAQNWSRLQHMPVHHLPGPKGRVFAQSVELDAWKLTGPVSAPSRVRKAITIRLLEDDLNNLRSLIPSKFPSMQELVSRAVSQYAEQQLNSRAELHAR